MEEGPCLGHRARCGEREGERRAAGAGEEEEGGQEAAVACVRPSVLEGEPRCEAAHTHSTHTHTARQGRRQRRRPRECVSGTRRKVSRGGAGGAGASRPPRRGGPRGGRDVPGVARGQGEGRQGGREGEREADAGPAAAALPHSPSLGPRPGPSPFFSRRWNGGKGKGKGDGARRYVTVAWGPGLPARGRAEGTRGQTPVRDREAPRERARCARVRVTRPSPHLCVCLCVCLVCACVSVSVTWGLHCRHNTGLPGRAGASEAVPQLSARAEGSLQGNGLQGEERGSPGAAVPSGTLPAL